MHAEIAALIEEVHDPAARPRLRECLPFLRSAVESVDVDQAPGTLVIACATPRAATVISTEGWPRIGRSSVSKSNAVLATIKAIESHATDNAEIIIGGLSVLLGRKGREAAELDAAQIIADGGKPMLVGLLQREGKSITLLITVIAIARESTTVH